MIICKTVEEFLDYYMNVNKSFVELAFENEEQYKELYEYCKKKKRNSNSLLILGDLYYYGIPIEKNYETAIKYYIKASKLNNIKAIYTLGYFYEKKLGCKKSYSFVYNYQKKAFKIYLKFAKKGDNYAMWILSHCFEKGIICEKNEAVAMDWKLKSAKYGNSFAAFELSVYYEYGIGCIRDYDLALFWREKAAKSGNINSIWDLAIRYEYGIECSKNDKLAFTYFEQAAKLGNVNAMYYLGRCYEQGLGCEKNDILAIEWYSKSIELGNVESIWSIAKNYESEEELDLKNKKSFELFQKYEKMNNANAMLLLSMCYQNGYGCDTNRKLAFDLLKHAAQLGNSTAICELALHYQYGVCCEANGELAFDLLGQSVKMNNSNAMYYLSKFYGIGYFCEKNRLISFKLLEKSAFLGNIKAMMALYKTDKSSDPLRKRSYEQNLEFSLYWYKRSMEYGNTNITPLELLKYVSRYGQLLEAEYIYWIQKGAEYGNVYWIDIVAREYEEGEKFQKDLTKAFQMYLKSAKLGSITSMNTVANYYANGIGCERDYENAFYWYLKAAENGNVLAMYTVANYYETGKGNKKNIDLALYWYKLSLEKGNEYAREDVLRVEQIIEQEKLRDTKLVFSDRKDVFISWNHFHKKIKDDLCENLEKRNFLTVWESDGHGVGPINECIKNAILLSHSYIVILTGNAIKSSWVAQEVEIILSKIKKNTEYENVIRPIIINKIIDAKTGIEYDYNVVEAIERLDDNNVFKKLLGYCASFEDFETGLNYEKIVSFLYEAIGNSLKIEYKNKIIEKFKTFSAALNTVVYSRDTKNGIIAATLEFESGYLNRYIYDKDNNQIKPHQLLLYNTPSLIYGEAGTGKSLYLKNFLRSEFKDNRYIFYLECRKIINVGDDFIRTLKRYSFDDYLNCESENILSLYSFKQIFNSPNNIIILIDALDEMSLENRKILIEKINIFSQQYKIKLILTSRNKKDANIINSIFNNNIDLYELRGVEIKDIERLYDNLSLKYQNKDIQERGPEDVFDPILSKVSFFEKIQDTSDDIKKNPLLISNLIFIYFATHKIPTTSFDIINESVLILINDLEEERSLDFEYKKYLKDEEINKILGYLALQRSYNNTNPAEVIIKKYLKENYENIDYSKIADEIYKYLRRRAIIVNENISHEIFKNYFASSYLFSLIYQLTEDDIQMQYYDFAEKGGLNLERYCDKLFSINDETWNNIAIDLLYKLDFEIYDLNRKKNMDKKHLSYEVFNTTLTKTLTEKGYNETTISIIKNLLDKISFHYNEFIKQYIK